MYDNILFLSMIARALQRADVRAAVREAFGQIQSMGEQPRYRHGYEQFLRFMASSQTAQVPSPVDRVAAGSIAAAPPLRIVVECAGTPVAVCRFHDRETTQVVAGIEPGHYRIRTETGLVLWKGSVTERQVVWAPASPSEAIPVAAKTEESGQEPTRQEHLAGAGMVLRFYAGAESGALEIEIPRREAKA